MEQLLRRATQANDLETALKIKQEIGAQNPATGITPATNGSLLSRLRKTTWTFDEGQGPVFLTFLGDKISWRCPSEKFETTRKVDHQKDGSILIQWGAASRRIEVPEDLSTMTVARAIAPDKKVTATQEAK